MNCKTCAGPCALKGSRIEGDCEGYKPMTHYEKIRAMSVDEMAELFEMIPYSGNPTYTIDGLCIDDGLRTKRQWLDWLRQEVKE